MTRQLLNYCTILQNTSRVLIWHGARNLPVSSIFYLLGSSVDSVELMSNSISSPVEENAFLLFTAAALRLGKYVTTLRQRTSCGINVARCQWYLQVKSLILILKCTQNTKLLLDKWKQKKWQLININF